MTPRSLNIKVRPQPMEKVVRGIIYPDTMTPKNQEWGVVTDGNGLVPDSSRVLYAGAKSFEKDGEKIVNKLKLYYWV